MAKDAAKVMPDGLRNGLRGQVLLYLHAHPGLWNNTTGSSRSKIVITLPIIIPSP